MIHSQQINNVHSHQVTKKNSHQVNKEHSRLLKLSREKLSIEHLHLYLFAINKFTREIEEQYKKAREIEKQEEQDKIARWVQNKSARHKQDKIAREEQMRRVKENHKSQGVSALLAILQIPYLSSIHILTYLDNKSMIAYSRVCKPVRVSIMKHPIIIKKALQEYNKEMQDYNNELHRKFIHENLRPQIYTELNSQYTNSRKICTSSSIKEQIKYFKLDILSRMRLYNLLLLLEKKDNAEFKKFTTRPKVIYYFGCTIINIETLKYLVENPNCKSIWNNRYAKYDILYSSSDVW
jgi:hypothetical protein